MKKVELKYDLEKDAENFLRGLRSVNNPEPTKLHKKFFDKCGDNLDEGSVANFLQERVKINSLNMEEVIERFSNQWIKIEGQFMERCESLFNISIPAPVIGYLSQSQRCTYNWQENYFFISATTKHSNGIIMHELLHFYTHRKFYVMSIDDKKFNDIKESLTVLLNTDFKDLMDGFMDDGYLQHQKIREEIVFMREQGKTIDDIFLKLATD